jgi:predicted ATP-dependent endonuclease of OLD family
MLYLKSLELENVRCFGKKQRIDFTGADGKISQWTVILGDNGTGKTSILRSIVSLLPSPQSFLERRNHLETEYNLSINNGWRNAWDLKHTNGAEDSVLSLVVAECEKPFASKYEYEIPLTHTVNHKKSNLDNSYFSTTKFDTRILSPVYCFAYGANRKVGTKSLSGEKLLQANETLFNEEALLQNSEEYFLQIDYETIKQKKGSQTRDKVKDLLLQILPTGVKDIRVGKAGRLQRTVQVETPFGWVSINELSLGYKTTIAWLIDFATKMMYYNETSKKPFEEPAILIIDEIDLHMHPAWQKEIIENLTKLFPKTQFIVTAHSPLIAQAALDSNLALLKRVTDHVKIINEPAIIRSWRVDQVLTSDLFGLKESRNPKVENFLRQRRNLLFKDDLNVHEKKKLKQLESKMDEIPIAETKEYIKAMEIVLKASKHSS